MTYFRPVMLGTALMLSAAPGAWAQEKSYPLDTVGGLTLINAVAEPVSYDGRKGLRIVMSEEGMRKMQSSGGEVNPIAVMQGLELSNGVIEAEIAGAPAPGAFEGARGFVGIAFRMQKDLQTYDAFYLRPTNGRAEDQERRNRSVQYISHPAWTWARFRKETPAKYESYVDLVPGAWTKIKIEVRGAQARLYVHDSPQPTLIINDVKTGAQGTGAVALWVGPGTIAHFRNLTIRK